MKKSRVIAFFLGLMISWAAGPVFAQLTDETREQREQTIEDRLDELEDQRNIKERPKTAEDVFEVLKKKAELRLQQRKKDLFLKTKMYAGLTYGYTSNPQGLQHDSEKGDFVVEDNFTFKWVPTFFDRLSGDFGYTYYGQIYSELENINSDDHSLSAGLKYYALRSGKLLIEPVIRYEWLMYPFDSSSGFEQIRPAMRLTYFMNNRWSYGGEYEWSFKSYDKQAARNAVASNTSSHREDSKDSFELWLKRNIATYYSIKLKEKSYFNDSNDEYQDYNDYESHRGFVTLAGSFLRNRKLYISYTADYEFRQYRNRLAVSTARADHIVQHGIYVYYPFTTFFSANYIFNWKGSSSSAAIGELSDISNKIGFTLNF